jgi:hypothetical protein
MAESWEEHTEIVPRVVVARRQRAAVFLACAAAAFSVGAATFVIPRAHHVEQATKDALAADAQQLGVILHASLTQTTDRAEGFAGTPVLEAGILTDAPTVADIVKTEYRLKTRPGETLELFQVRAGDVTSLVRVPASARPIAFLADRRTRLEYRDGLAVVVSAEVAPYNNTPELSGVLAVAVTVDLAKLPLAKHAIEASLIHDGPPIALVHGQHATDDTAVTLAVPLDPKWRVGPLALHAVPVMTAYLAPWVRGLRYGALALGVVFACTFLVAVRRLSRR